MHSIALKVHWVCTPYCGNIAQNQRKVQKCTLFPNKLVKKKYIYIIMNICVVIYIE